MELSTPGKDLIGEYESRILFGLIKEKQSISGRQLARKTGVPNSTVQRMLNKFETTGLVTSDQHPGIVLYSINRQHLLYPIVLEIFEIRNKMFTILKEHFEPYIKEEGSVFLTGSTANFQSGADTPVDMLLVLPEETEEGEHDIIKDQLYEVADNVKTILGNELTIITCVRKELKIWTKTEMLQTLISAKHVAGLTLEEQFKEIPAGKTAYDKLIQPHRLLNK